MTVKFSAHELPIAYSMIRVARTIRRRQDNYHPFQKYVYLWTAFNNIYTTIAYSDGKHSDLILDGYGVPEASYNGSVQIPRVRRSDEKSQIDSAFTEFDRELKQSLILHENTQYFFNRIPSWQGQRIEYDARGQKVNGVINVNFTTRPDYPVWSPIDVVLYPQYLANSNDDNAREFLARQIVYLLYTVRNNLLHGGKRFDDANDIEVVDSAMVLLQIIVSAFTY